MPDIVPRISELNDTRTPDYPISMMPRTRGMRHCLNSIMTKRTHILQSMMPRPPELVNSIMPRRPEILNSFVLQKHQELLTSILQKTSRTTELNDGKSCRIAESMMPRCPEIANSIMLKAPIICEFNYAEDIQNRIQLCQVLRNYRMLQRTPRIYDFCCAKDMQNV